MAGCSTTSAGATVAGSGQPVDVLYAASLIRPIEDVVAPAFDRSSGSRFRGFAGGSVALAHEVVSGVRPGDVFVSASPSVDATLAAAGAGGTWYVTFASVPLVLGYDPHSRFAAALRRGPWYAVVTTPGFALGRTDPALDPKGLLAREALDAAAEATHDRALGAVAQEPAGVFPEETLLGRLEAGQLDAAFLYRDEAVAAHVPYVSLAPESEHTTFTVTVLRGATHRASALAFVEFLLGPTARRVLAAEGLDVSGVTLHGSGAPPALRAWLAR
jgi:molybdate/tungstate transport system substrate-binding protein